MSNIEILGFSDPFSSMTHILAAGIFLIIGIVSLVRQQRPVGHTVSLVVFVVAVTFLLSMSGVYHLLTPETTGRMVLQRLDHAAIFFLIAASFTPIHVMLFRGFSRWGILLLIWGIAITGITIKVVFFDDLAESTGLMFYLGQGWLGLVSGYLLYRRFGFRYLKLLLLGAVAYTVGAIIDFLGAPVLVARVLGPHELFHVMVLLGILLHWNFIFHVVSRSAQTLTSMQTMPDKGNA